MQYSWSQRPTFRDSVHETNRSTLSSGVFARIIKLSTSSMSLVVVSADLFEDYLDLSGHCPSLWFLHFSMIVYPCEVCDTSICLLVVF